MKVIDTIDGKEVAFSWTCPGCQHINNDSVHPLHGPFWSLTCDGCGLSFDDDALSLKDLTRWADACYLSETTTRQIALNGDVAHSTGTNGMIRNEE